MKKSWLGALLVSALGLAGLAAMAQNDSEGTLGFNVLQAYDDNSPDKRGDLIVVNVDERYAAAKAGLKNGDIIFEVDGQPVKTRDMWEISRTKFHGAPGGRVSLKVYRPSTGMPVEFSMLRTDYLPIETSAADPFYFVTPGSWHPERHVFPVEWAPDLGYKGVEDIRFAPHFADPKSEDYFSYVYVWWIDGKPELDAAQLEQGLQKYYRGLSKGFAQQAKFDADLDKLAAALKKRKTGEFSGTASTYDSGGKLLALNAEVTVLPCGTDHTAVWFNLSPAQFDTAVWKDMRTIRNTFKCSK